MGGYTPVIKLQKFRQDLNLLFKGLQILQDSIWIQFIRIL